MSFFRFIRTALVICVAMHAGLHGMHRKTTIVDLKPRTTDVLAGEVHHMMHLPSKMQQDIIVLKQQELDLLKQQVEFANQRAQEEFDYIKKNDAGADALALKMQKKEQEFKALREEDAQTFKRESSANQRKWSIIMGLGGTAGGAALSLFMQYLLAPRVIIDTHIW